MNGRAWTDEELQALTAMAGQGMSVRAIGKLLQRSHGSVGNKARAVGITLLRPEPYVYKQTLPWPKPGENPHDAHVTAFTRAGRGYDGLPYPREVRP